jgi:hypothetical protein
VETLLEALTRREIVVALAITGAVLATLGSAFRGRLKRRRQRLANVAVYLGYAITGASVALFITAGFRS